MPEYRRFVAYFYEYINGKKQKNAGFAKVELRNGMWRILLRLTTGILPEPPVQVYGFVREEDDLPGILLGTMRPAREAAEEWAFRADAPIGEGNYRLKDLSGILVRSGDGRCFATVWDEEGIDLGRFVPEAERGAETDSEAPGPSGTEAPEVPGLRLPEPEMLKRDEAPGPEKDKEPAEPSGGTESGLVDLRGAESGPEGDAEPEMPEPVSDAGVMSETRTEENVAASGVEPEEDCRSGDGSRPAGSAIEELIRKRTSFQPFPDEEISNCVMIMPCDIVRLQQENWKVGRSSFLQHGFYQYRHLMLGTSGDGTYILGVPGIRNPQETYMARMFGFEWFKESAARGCGQPFGYWCRVLSRA